MIPVRAVIFDYGNVLCEPQRESDLTDMASVCGLERRVLEPLYWQLREDYDRGEFDVDHYWTQIGVMAGKKLSQEQIKAAALADSQSWSRPSMKMVRWIKALKASGIDIAILSNMPLALKLYIDANCDWLSDFEHRVYSCDVGCVKPDPQIYHHCLKLLNLPPQATLFLDDRAPNVEAAQSLGIHSLVFSNLDHAAQEIKERFVLPMPELDHAG
jgi:putative hydrolase of the HAD superfamily